MIPNREERKDLREQQMKELNRYWKKGIPDIKTTEEEKQKLKEYFSQWSFKFQVELLNHGVDPIIDQYEKLIHSIENGTCDHGNGINKGKDYQNCCGVSYEYLNDISCREAIEIIWRTIKEDNKSDRTKRIEMLDSRFKAVPKTEKWIINESSIPKYEKLGYWWLKGLPLTVNE